MMPMEKSGNDSMDKKSAIQEYCEACRKQVGIPDNNGKTDYQRHEEHLRSQDMQLDIIRRQSKPNFGRDVLANIVGSASYDVLLGVLKRLV